MTPRKRSQSSDVGIAGPPLKKQRKEASHAGNSNNKNNNATDPSTWRKSRIRAKTRINRTNITKKYRLNDEDLEGLQYKTAPTSVRIPARSAPGGKRYVEAHMYVEREVEQRAWRKHGGPEAFEEYIARLDKAKRRRLQHFAHESASASPPGDDHDVVILPHAPAPAPVALTAFEKYTRDQPSILHLANHFLGKWVFERAYEALNAAGVPDHERVPALYEALRQIEWLYPLRPYPRDPPLPDSPPVMRLRAVLERAPYAGIEDPNIHHYFNIETGCEEWRWAGEFLDDLFEVLNLVLHEHGWVGWRRARWEVYEKSVETLGGIICDRDDPYSFTWRDESAEWLAGRLDEDEDTFHETRGTSVHGWRYNNSLPG